MLRYKILFNFELLYNTRKKIVYSKAEGSLNEIYIQLIHEVCGMYFIMLTESIN